MKTITYAKGENVYRLHDSSFLSVHLFVSARRPCFLLLLLGLFLLGSVFASFNDHAMTYYVMDWCDESPPDRAEQNPTTGGGRRYQI